MSDPIVITVERRFAAPPEVVFDAWLDATNVGHWLFATPDGAMERVEIDPCVGGRFLIAERRGGELAEHFGQYLEIDRPRRLAFTFGYASGDVRDDEETRVTIEIVPDGDGARLKLTQVMDAKWADYEARTREGWAMILEGLARAAL